MQKICLLQPLRRIYEGAYRNWDSVLVGEDAAASEEMIHEGASGEENGCLVRS